MKLALIADFGTNHIKTGVVDGSGALLASAGQTVDLKRPEKGAVEHDPEELFDHFTRLCRQVTAGLEDRISVLGLSGYQFGFMPMDSSNRPLTGMITLLDTRSKGIMERLERELPYADIYKRTGCPPFFTYILSRLIWLRETKPEIFSSAAWYADIKSYLLQRLCDKRCTDPGIASATQLFNIHSLDWDEEMLRLAGIRREQLPKVVRGEQVVETLSLKTAEMLGLKQGVPVIPGIYDGGALLLGLGGYDCRMGVCNLGTTAMLRTCSDRVMMDDPEQRRLQTYALTGERWAFGAALNNAGVALRWFRDNLASTVDYRELDRRAGEIGPCSDGLFSLPFFTGERDPRIGSQATASFFGLKEYHSTGHMSRSILEGVGFGLNLIKKVIDEKGVTMEAIRLGGAGGNSALWSQILADIFDKPVSRSLTGDATCTGAAILAFTATGDYRSVEAASDAMVRTGESFTPVTANVQAYREGFDFYAGLIGRFKEIYAEHGRRFADG